MSGGRANLKPWPKGVSGNPGGRPRKKHITEELERLLAEEAPKGKGQTWATVIAKAFSGTVLQDDALQMARAQRLPLIRSAELARLRSSNGYMSTFIMK